MGRFAKVKIIMPNGGETFGIIDRCTMQVYVVSMTVEHLEMRGCKIKEEENEENRFLNEK